MAKVIQKRTRFLGFWTMCRLGIFTLLPAALLIVALLDRPSYRLLIREDGLVENASFVWWAIAAGVWLSIALRRPARPPLWDWIFACFCVLCAGEEIDWGQRLFRWETPARLVTINRQDATNLHNLWSTSIWMNALLAASAFIFLIWPVVARRVDLPGAPVPDRTSRFVFLLGLAGWFAIGLKYRTFGFGPYSALGLYNQLDDEFMEFHLALTFLSFALGVSLEEKAGAAPPATPARF